MFLQDNFSEMHLLFSEPVQCTLYTDSTMNILLTNFMVKVPTVKDLYFNPNVMFILGLIKKTVPELIKDFKLFQNVSSHLDFIHMLSKLKNQTPSIVNYLYKIIKGLQFLCEDIVLDGDQLFINKRPITDEIFERLRYIWMTSIDAKSFSKMYQYMTPEERAIEDKIQAIKNKGKNQQNNDSFEKIYITLTYEFNYTREQILNMTMYAVKTILKYTSKSINYKLTLLAKAYGNTKKVRFITDKGE